LRGKKDWPVAVWAARRLGLRCVLAGVDGGEGPALRAAGAELTGWIDDAALDALLRGAACLVHPSRYEGFGLVLLEAMARGVPVACADATSLPEVAGGAAELFAPGDVAGCADAVARAIAAGGERGRARAAGFSWARTARETRAVYEELR